MQCQQISVGHGQEEIIDVALATAVRTDTWLVIENLQLASRHWLEQLYNRLSRLQLQAGGYKFGSLPTNTLLIYEHNKTSERTFFKKQNLQNTRIKMTTDLLL